MRALRDLSPWHRVHVLGFPLLLAITGLLFLAGPKAQVSDEERRSLKALPAFSSQALASGAYFKDLDAYVSDHFVFRSAFMRVAAVLRANWGFDDGGVRVYAPRPEPEAVPDASAALARPGPAPGSPKPARVVRTARDEAGEGYRSINSVLVYRNRAVQVFGGNAARAGAFAQMVNRMQAVLGPEVTVYCMAIPIGSDFYLPRAIYGGQAREKANIDELYARLGAGVRPVRAYEELASRTDEYIQFRTDHHWTGRGAYHAYTAFAAAAQVTPLPMSALTRIVIPGFVGSLYHHTQAEELLAHPDEVEVFKVPNRTEASYFPDGLARAVPTRLYFEGARGGAAYGVFLGADHGLMRIVSDAGNGRRILVIKDSYGNAFVPYLVPHYEEVFVLDYRYFNGQLPEVMKRWNIRELLIAHNTFMVNSGYTVARGLTMIGEGSAAPLSRAAVAAAGAAAASRPGGQAAPRAGEVAASQPAEKAAARD